MSCYGHAEIASRLAALHDQEETNVRGAFDAVTSRVPDADVGLQLGSVVGKAINHAKDLGLSQRAAERTLEIELDIIRRSW